MLCSHHRVSFKFLKLQKLQETSPSFMLIFFFFFLLREGYVRHQVLHFALFEIPKLFALLFATKSFGMKSCNYLSTVLSVLKA